MMMMFCLEKGNSTFNDGDDDFSVFCQWNFFGYPHIPLPPNKNWNHGTIVT